jgi:hypothetical protein
MGHRVKFSEIGIMNLEQLETALLGSGKHLLTDEAASIMPNAYNAAIAKGDDVDGALAKAFDAWYAHMKEWADALSEHMETWADKQTERFIGKES